MKAQLEALIEQLEAEGRPGLKKSIGVSWVSYDSQNPKPCNGSGTNWSGSEPFYPASVVKLVYALAAEAWIQKDLLPDTYQLRDAIKDMITNSSNDATSLVLDLLTATTSGPSLKNEQWESWQRQRQLINNWLDDLGWTELLKVNCCQKTWSDGPYGRERDFYSSKGRNALTTDATARLLESIMTNALVSPPACKRLREIFSRSIEIKQRKQDPENQVDGFLGAGLPKGTQLWSKAGWMSQARHDAAWCCPPRGNPMLLIVFSKGTQRANDEVLLPTIAKTLFNHHQQMMGP